MKIGMILLGVALIAGSAAFLAYNEYSNYNKGNMLSEVTSSVVNIDDVSTVNPDNENRLVHLSGLATTEDIINDDIFGLSFNALSLQRDVKYYQWEETQISSEGEKDGNRTAHDEYAYEKRWVDEPVHSSDFHTSGHKNTCPLMIKDDTTHAANVCVGAYRLTEEQIQKIDSFELAKFNYDSQYKETIRNQIVGYFGDKANVEVYDGVIFMGVGTFNNPEIGDMTVTFRRSLPCDVTIIAKQTGDSFSHFIVKKNSFFYIIKGTVSAENVLSGMKEDNLFGVWVNRFVGVLFLIIGVVVMKFNM